MLIKNVLRMYDSEHKKEIVGLFFSLLFIFLSIRLWF